MNKKELKELQAYERMNNKIIKLQAERKELNKQCLEVYKQEQNIMNKYYKNEITMCQLTDDTKTLKELKGIYKGLYKDNAEKQKICRALIKESETVIKDLQNELKRIAKYKRENKKNAK